jgi:trehalose 6-phosphate phosphatase
MEHLLTAWPQIVEQIHNSKHVLFLTDFDGTLTPIVEKPEDAVLTDASRKMLQALAHQKTVTVGIISGRALADLKEKVNLSGMIYAGNHGLEIEGPGLFYINPLAEEIKPFFRIIRKMLDLTLGSIKGVLFEDKGLSLSVHYRQVEEEKARHLQDVVERAANAPGARNIFRLTSGKKVYEIRPAVNWDKGKAIRLLMKRFGKGGRQSGLLPIYLGDDLTDEDGFKMIEKYGNGITVYIGEDYYNSAARYYLRSPDEVTLFIIKFLEQAKGSILCEQYSAI